MAIPNVEMTLLSGSGPGIASSSLPLSRSNSSSSAGGGSRRRSRSLTKPPNDALIDPNRTMDHIMGLMLAVCRGSVIPIEGSSTASHAGTMSSTLGNIELGFPMGTNSGSSTNSRQGMKLSSSINVTEASSNPNSHPNSRSGSVKEGIAQTFTRSDSLDKEQPRPPHPSICSGNGPFSNGNTNGSAYMSSSSSAVGARANMSSLSVQESEKEGSPVTGIDNAAVICCDALLLLSSIPQCRTSLVSGGIALPLLRSWLDACSTLLSAELSWRIDMGIKFNSDEGSMLHLTQVLITKVCSVLVNLMGGDGYTDSFVSSPAIPGETGSYIGESATSYASSGTNNEDMTGWIDTQLVSQGVAASLIRLVAASVEDHTTFCQADGISKGEQTSVSLLPRSIEIQLARILHHLCSRHNAQRRLLLALGFPTRSALFSSTQSKQHGTLMLS